MKLMEALSSITEEDLELADKRITVLQQELEMLREAKKLMEIRLGMRTSVGVRLSNGRRKHRQAAEEAVEDNTVATKASKVGGGSFEPLSMTEIHREKCVRWLRDHGPTAQGALAKQCNVPVGSITNVLKDRRFKHTARGVELA